MRLCVQGTIGHASGPGPLGPKGGPMEPKEKAQRKGTAFIGGPSMIIIDGFPLRFIDGNPSLFIIFIDGVQQWISMDFQFFEIQFFEKTMKNNKKLWKTNKIQQKPLKNYKKPWKNHEGPFGGAFPVTKSFGTRGIRLVGFVHVLSKEGDPMGPKKGAQRKGAIFIDGPSMNSLLEIHQWIHWCPSMNSLMDFHWDSLMDVQQWISMDFQFFEIRFFSYQECYNHCSLQQ